MTLIELVVALTISVAVLTAGYRGFILLLDRREAATIVLEMDLQAVAVRAAIQTWLRDVYQPSDDPSLAFVGSDGVHGNVSDDQVSFVTGGAMGSNGGGPRRIRLSVNRDPRQGPLGLVAEFEELNGGPRQVLQLVPEVDALDARYRSRLLRGREWHLSWISSSVVPNGVEIRLAAPADSLLHPLLALPIRISLPGGR